MSVANSKSRLSLPRRRLVELLQRMNFGALQCLEVRNGEPVLDPAPKRIIDYKFCAENGPRRELASSDFALKSQFVELFLQFDRMRNGVIDVLEVKHGLPFLMRVSDAA